MESFVKVPRAWIDDRSLFDPRDAMILLKILSLVNPGRVTKAHGQVLRSGQVLVGTRCLELLLGIPRTTIHRHLKRLEKEGKIQLRVLPHMGGTVITIPALLNEESGTRLGTQVGTQSGTTKSSVGTRVYGQEGGNNGTESGTQLGTPLGTNQERKKDHLGDETHSLGKEDPILAALENHWLAEYRRRYSLDHALTKHDRERFKGLLRYSRQHFNGSAEKSVREAITAFIRDDDHYAVDQRHPLAFLSKYPQRWFPSQSTRTRRPEF